MADTPDDDKLAGLTDEERAAYEAEEGAEIDGSAELETPESWASTGWADAPAPAAAQTEDTVAAQTEDTVAAQTEDTVAAQGQDTAPAEGQDTAAAAPAEDTAAAAPKADEVPDDAGPMMPADAPDPAAIDQRLGEIDEQFQRLDADYADGELTDDEHRQKRAELLESRDALVKDRAKVEFLREQEDRAWDTVARRYLSENQQLTQDDGVKQAFAREVERTTAPGSPVAHLPFRKQLEAAHRALYANADLLGLQVPPPPGAAQQQATTQPPAPATTQQPAPPTTLRDLPNAAPNDPQDGAYAALEAVMRSGDPEAIEAALARMTPEERDRYASMMV